MNNIEYLTDKINELQTRLENMSRFKVPQRIVCELKKLRLKYAPQEQEFKLPVSKSTLALRVGIEQETFSRAIPKLSEHGALVVGKTIIIDKDKSISAVCNHCTAREWCRAV